MRVDLENERRAELDRLIAKYEKIKRQLKQIQDSESIRVDRPLLKADTLMKLARSKDKVAKSGSGLLQSKKKVLMNKIKKLDNLREL